MQTLINAYLRAKRRPLKTRPRELAELADRMAGKVFDNGTNYGQFKPPTCSGMMAVEAHIFAVLCDSNVVDWRNLQ